jgi:hypothetical protein
MEALAFLLPRIASQNLLTYLKIEKVITTWGGREAPKENKEVRQKVM